VADKRRSSGGEGPAPRCCTRCSEVIDTAVGRRASVRRRCCGGD
jgi:hypothetical protein